MESFYDLEGDAVKVKGSEEEHLSSFPGGAVWLGGVSEGGLWSRDERASPVTCQAEARTMGSGRVWARPAQCL